MTSKTIEIRASDGIAIRAEQWASAGRRWPVVLLHGLGFASRHWVRQIEALAREGYGVIAVDLRGFGASELGASYAIETLAHDVEAVRVAAEVERVHLVGHSMGGMVALRYALEQPAALASLVLASTSAHSGRRAAAFARAMAMLSEEGFDAAVADPERRAAVEAIIAEVVPFVGEVMALLRKLTHEPSRARALAWEAIGRFSVKDELGAIGCPTLVLHGDADQNIPFAAGELVHRGIAASEWVPLAGVAHNLPLDAAEAFNARLLAFLARAEDPR